MYASLASSRRSIQPVVQLCSRMCFSNVSQSLWSSILRRMSARGAKQIKQAPIYPLAIWLAVFNAAEGTSYMIFNDQRDRRKGAGRYADPCNKYIYTI